jgi:hypothetical protein
MCSSGNRGGTLGYNAVMQILIAIKPKQNPLGRGDEEASRRDFPSGSRDGRGRASYVCPVAPGRTDLLLEGNCVGATPVSGCFSAARQTVTSQVRRGFHRS